MARIVCDVPPQYPESEDQGFAMTALINACEECGVSYSVLTDADGLPSGYRGVVANVNRESFARVLVVIARDHDEADIADSFGLLDCEFDTSGMFQHQRVPFYTIEED